MKNFDLDNAMKSFENVVVPDLEALHQKVLDKSFSVIQKHSLLVSVLSFYMLHHYWLKSLFASILFVLGIVLGYRGTNYLAQAFAVDDFVLAGLMAF